MPGLQTALDESSLKSPSGVFNQEICDTFEFGEKPRCDHRSGLFVVKIQGVVDILLRPRVERVGYRWSFA